MLSLSVSARTRGRMADRLISTYTHATGDQLARGESWYRRAHDLATQYAAGDTRLGASVIAVASANKGWKENTDIARRVLHTRVPSGHTGSNLVKMQRLLDGAHPDEVLPVGKKTYWFYATIADPDHPTAVVVDRHAADLCDGVVRGQANRGLSTQSRYDLYCEVFRKAAQRIGCIPSELQAVTWTVHVERLSGLGTRRVRPSDH